MNISLTVSHAYLPTYDRLIADCCLLFYCLLFACSHVIGWLHFIRLIHFVYCMYRILVDLSRYKCVQCAPMKPQNICHSSFGLLQFRFLHYTRARLAQLLTYSIWSVIWYLTLFPWWSEHIIHLDVFKVIWKQQYQIRCASVCVSVCVCLSVCVCANVSWMLEYAKRLGLTTF